MDYLPYSPGTQWISVFKQLNTQNVVFDGASCVVTTLLLVHKLGIQSTSLHEKTLNSIDVRANTPIPNHVRRLGILAIY